MTRSFLPLSLALAAAALGTLSLTAAAGVQRTFVASTGSDANPCSLTQPCRQFAAALAQTNPGGEIIVLDSAGYGSVTIDKAVSIIAPAGIYAGITNGTVDGIVVNAPGADVVLRGLDINGLGTSPGAGILHQAAASLLIDRCTVTGFANDNYNQDGPTGIRLLAGPVVVVDTTVKNNRRGGISVRGANAQNQLRVTIVRSRIENNADGHYNVRDAGISAIAAALVTVKDSYVVGNFRGLSACAAGLNEPAGAALSLENTLVDRNVVGMLVASNGVACAMRASHSTITNNSLYGIEQQGGSLVTSLGNNFVYNNAASETFGLTQSPK